MSEQPRGHGDLWADLRRHPAFQAALLFGGAAWLALQAGDIFGLETATLRRIGGAAVLVFLLLLGGACTAVLRARAAGANARSGLNARVVAAVLGVLLLLGGGAWLARPHVLKGAVLAGADVIVVLPFQASGAGVELLGEGLVDLLSTNLDEVGAIRTVNPRTTLHQYRQHAVNGSIDLDGALRVGRAVGAGSVLLGSVVSAGGEARVSAELHAVDGGHVIARAQKSGAADNVLALVDELSIELMRDIWRSRQPLPQLRVSAITTPSVPAIRAYMRGEQFYRRVQWDSARVAFAEAIEHDSTFALAHFRLAEAYGWSESIGSAESRRHSGAAARFADRLPARERALVIAHKLHEDGDVAAIDSFRAYTLRYPDDATGWYMLADARFHAAPATGADLLTLLEGFEKVHGLDPSYAQPYAHLLEVSFLLDDRDRYDRYLADYGMLVDDDVARIYHTLRTVRWSPREEALAAVEAALGAGAATSQGVFERLGIAAMLRSYGEPADIDFLADVTHLLARVLADAGPGVAEQFAGLRAATFASGGRFREADATLEVVRRASGQQALGAVLPLIVLDAAPAGAFAAEREALAAAPSARGPGFWRAVQALQRGDAATAAREIDVVRRDTAAAGPSLPPGSIEGLEAWLLVARGDTVRGVKALRDASLRTGYGPMNRGPIVPLRVQLALLQASQPETRAEGIQRLEMIALMETSLSPFVYVPLADAYATAGDSERAAFWYNRFIDVWRGADAEVQPQLDAARAALQRLGQERRAS
jgi:eukaryotic-like serine/threonine-protein kinase